MTGKRVTAARHYYAYARLRFSVGIARAHLVFHSKRGGESAGFFDGKINRLGFPVHNYRFSVFVKVVGHFRKLRYVRKLRLYDFELDFLNFVFAAYGYALRVPITACLRCYNVFAVILLRGKSAV